MTVKDLINSRTKLNAHQRTIAKHLRALNPRTQKMIRDHAAGATAAGIAAGLGIGRQSAAEAIDRGIEAIRKAIAGEPRFNHIGSPGRGKRATPQRS